MLVYLNV